MCAIYIWPSSTSLKYCLSPPHFLHNSYNHYLPNDGTNLNILLVVFQAVIAVLCVGVARRMQWLEPLQVTRQTYVQWAPVNILFCAMLFTGMASLTNNSVPMVTVFKNVTNLFTATGDAVFFGNRPEGLAWTALGILLAGALLAAQSDLTVTSTGLLWMMANCVSTSSYVLYMKYATSRSLPHLNKFAMVLVNNVLAIAFLLPVALVTGQVTTVVSTTALHTSSYVLLNIFAGTVGFCLNYASLHCVATTGPTTYAIVGSLNKIPVAVLGYFLFDTVLDSKTAVYMTISLGGGFLYSYAKIRASASNKTTSNQAR